DCLGYTPPVPGQPGRLGRYDFYFGEAADERSPALLAAGAQVPVEVNRVQGQPLVGYAQVTTADPAVATVARDAERGLRITTHAPGDTELRLVDGAEQTVDAFAFQVRDATALRTRPYAAELQLVGTRVDACF